MDASALIAAILGLLFAFAAWSAARGVPAQSRTRGAMQQAVGVVIILSLLPVVLLFVFRPSENIIVWFGALIVGFGAFCVLMMAIGLLTGAAKGWDSDTRRWLTVTLLGSLLALGLISGNLVAGQAWYAFSNVGLVFGIALLLFICLALHGPEMEQASSNEQEMNND